MPLSVTVWYVGIRTDRKFVSRRAGGTQMRDAVTCKSSSRAVVCGAAGTVHTRGGCLAVDEDSGPQEGSWSEQLLLISVGAAVETLLAPGCSESWEASSPPPAHHRRAAASVASIGAHSSQRREASWAPIARSAYRIEMTRCGADGYKGTARVS